MHQWKINEWIVISVVSVLLGLHFQFPIWRGRECNHLCHSYISVNRILTIPSKFLKSIQKKVFTFFFGARNFDSDHVLEVKSSAKFQVHGQKGLVISSCQTIHPRSNMRCTVDGSEIPNNHLGCIKTLKIPGYTTNLNWLAGFLNHQTYWCINTMGSPWPSSSILSRCWLPVQAFIISYICKQYTLWWWNTISKKYIDGTVPMYWFIWVFY